MDDIDKFDDIQTVATPLLQPQHAVLAASYQRLIGLAESCFPQAVTGPTGSSPERDWHVLRLALVARIADVARTMLVVIPSERHLDGTTLARNLVDHVVHLAWLAANPTTRVPRFVRADYQNRLRLHQQLYDQTGTGVLSAEDRKSFAAYVGAHKHLAEPMPLETLAEEADSFWASRLGDIFGEPPRSTSFTTFYRELYAPYSWASHPSLFGLRRYWSFDGASATLTGDDVSQHDRPMHPYETSVWVFAHALAVATDDAGLPDRARLRTTVTELTQLRKAERESRLAVSRSQDGTLTISVDS